MANTTKIAKLEKVLKRNALTAQQLAQKTGHVSVDSVTGAIAVLESREGYYVSRGINPKNGLTTYRIAA